VFDLGQISEFSLLIAHLAGSYAIIGSSAQNLIQAAAIMTFIVSSYITVLTYPTPVAVSDRLRRD
jgi:predicted Kef-type K+ transport protein